MGALDEFHHVLLDLCGHGLLPVARLRTPLVKRVQRLETNDYVVHLPSMIEIVGERTDAFVTGGERVDQCLGVGFVQFETPNNPGEVVHGITDPCPYPVDDTSDLVGVEDDEAWHRVTVKKPRYIVQCEVCGLFLDQFIGPRAMLSNRVPTRAAPYCFVRERSNASQSDGPPRRSESSSPCYPARSIKAELVMNLSENASQLVCQLRSVFTGRVFGERLAVSTRTWFRKYSTAERRRLGRGLRFESVAPRARIMPAHSGACRYLDADDRDPRVPV